MPQSRSAFASRSSFLLCAVVATAAGLAAQRGKPTAEWQKRSTVVEYGVVPVGKHSIDSLKVGDSWRLGMNDASFWQLGMPIVVGERLLAPGTYRIALGRSGEEQFALLAQGAGLAVGGSGDVQIEGSLAKADKPANKLAIEWVTKAAPVDGNKPVQLGIKFGTHHWVAPMTLLGSKSKGVGTFTLTVFAVPQAFVEARSKAAVVVAVLEKKGASPKDPEAWNLVVDGSQAKLVPWMEAPTDQRGFGQIAGPAADRTTTGTLAVETVDGDAAPTLQMKEAALTKGELTVTLVAGKELLRIAVPEPKPAKK